MIETIAFVLVVFGFIVAGLLAYAATRPNTVRYARSIRIDAPPERITPLISDFRKWADWSPWEKKDPQMQRTFGGSVDGVGAVYAWNGNKNVGSGRMEILESTPTAIRIKLDFLAPFKASNVTEFTFAPQRGATEVGWVMTGENLFIGKVMGIFIDMDKMIGRDFDAGLAAMKAAAEGR